MQNIDPTKIKIIGRLRDVDESEVDKIAVSMSEIGQITPIEVGSVPDADGFYVLIAGAHRVKAALKNGDKTIQASLFDGSPDQARLREIDENLYRHELTAYDQANFLFERRLIWERLNGKVKPGRDKRKSRQLGAIEERDDLVTFYSNVGDLFSLPKRTVQRALERKRCIIDPIWQRIRGTAEAKNGALLDKIADIEPGDQKKIFEFCLASGNTFAHGISHFGPRGTKKPPSVSLMMKKLLAAWSEWNPEERAVFLRETRKLK